MCTATPAPLLCQRLPLNGSTPASGFTLVELLVVMVILSILGSLTLAGLNVGRQRAKRDRTISTISKINDVIHEQYDAYATRYTAGAAASRLGQLRSLMVEELPDTWANVPASSAACTTPACRAYARYKARCTAPLELNRYQNAECLYMILSRSGFAPDAIETFRNDEVADVDKDNLKEFVDGWGNPIGFLRWAPGFSSDATPPASLGWPGSFPIPSKPRTLSPLQIADPQGRHDPLDITHTDTTAFELIPLIYSPGPDQVAISESSSDDYAGIFVGDAPWPMTGSALQSGICITGTTKLNPSSGAVVTTLIGSPTPDADEAYRDNITNHDIMVR